MDIIELTRELGKALQNDDRYIAYQLAKQVNDEDEELQRLMNEFEELRREMNEEMRLENHDTDRIAHIDADIKQHYRQIMNNKNMLVFSAAQRSLESLVSSINQIISLCANGEDPDTCEPTTGCGGSCASCRGCG
ncbi:MAG: YlbF family regulator [Ruminococcus sp.]|nr:YlbF family regulator [Ruminococcus sp.]